MAKTRREFTPEFKREAVALLESSGRPQMQIAAELGIQPSMLRQWRMALMGGSSPPPRQQGPREPCLRAQRLPPPTKPPRSPVCGVNSTGRAWSATS